MGACTVRIGWIGHVLENSGWGRANRGYLRALLTQDVEVQCFPISFRPISKNNIPKDISETLVYNKKNIRHPDTVIYHTLPQYFEKLSVPSIGCEMYETFNVEDTLQYEHTTIMDKIWSPNKENVDYTRTFHVPFPVEEEVYQPVPSMVYNELKDTYVFYTIAELSKRKNVWATVIAYYSKFTIDDPVTLFLKLRHPQMGHLQLMQECQNQLNHIQDACNIHKCTGLYPKVVFETEEWTEQQILALHDFGDCFVSTSFGEAWSYPTMDALVRGNTVITTPHEGARVLHDYIGPNSCKYVDFCDVSEDLVYDHANIPQYNTSKEQWLVPNRRSVAELMYSRFTKGKRQKTINNQMIDFLSYDNVGKRMMKRL